MDHYTTDKAFSKADLAAHPLEKGEYERCTFTGCDLSNADLSGISFVECAFLGCNLSMTKLMKTAFREVQFTDCKMLGMHFEHCAPFGLVVSFENCILDHSSFYQVKLKGTTFRNTRLHEADLTECDLSGALFDQCDLTGTTFDRTIMEKADLRTAMGYSIDPERNKIRKAKFSISGVTGLLLKYDISIDMMH